MGKSFRKIKKKNFKFEFKYQNKIETNKKNGQ